MHKIDTPDATRDGRFTEGDPTVPVPATTVSADWLNAVQDEVLAVLSAAGLTPAKNNNAQLLAALKKIVGTVNALTATRLENARLIDGVSFNGTADIHHYTTCATASSTAAKTAALTGFKLQTGSALRVKFANANTVAGATLNVNGTGAKPLYYQGKAVPAGLPAAGHMYTVVFNGTQYEIVGDILALESGGGLAFNAERHLFVDFSLMPSERMQAIVLAMVQEGGGLAVDKTGKLYVDFSQMPTDKFEALLKSIRVPIWVESAKSFYVNQATGSDTLDVGRGESVGKPFKTIQACLDYVTSNYNLNRYNIGIRIYPGVYNEQLKLGDFSRTTGYIALIDHEGNYGVTINQSNAVTISASGGLWYLRGLVLKNTAAAVDDGVAHFYSVLSATAGTVHLEGCDILQEYTGAAPTSGSVYLRTLAAYGANAVIQFDATTKARNHLRFHKGNVTNMAVLFAERGGSIQCVSSNTSQDYVSIHCEGETDSFLYLSNSKFYSIGGAKYLTQFVVDAEKSVTGSRYKILNNSMCSVASKGPEFFPGDRAGTIEESTYCVYK